MSRPAYRTKAIKSPGLIAPRMTWVPPYHKTPAAAENVTKVMVGMNTARTAARFNATSRVRRTWAAKRACSYRSCTNDFTTRIPERTSSKIVEAPAVSSWMPVERVLRRRPKNRATSTIAGSNMRINRQSRQFMRSRMVMPPTRVTTCLAESIGASVRTCWSEGSWNGMTRPSAGQARSGPALRSSKWCVCAMFGWVNEMPASASRRMRACCAASARSGKSTTTVFFISSPASW